MPALSRGLSGRPRTPSGGHLPSQCGAFCIADYVSSRTEFARVLCTLLFLYVQATDGAGRRCDYLSPQHSKKQGACALCDMGAAPYLY